MIDISLVISIAAFLLSLVTIYFQWFRVKGPKIELLNTSHSQRSIVFRYEYLPKNVQQKFSYFYETKEGYAFVKLVYGNSGDRTGIVNIRDIQQKDDIKASYHSYTAIPPYEIVEQEILLRNIPYNVKSEVEIALNIDIEWGGYHARSGKYVQKASAQKTLKINLTPIVMGPPPPAFA